MKPVPGKRDRDIHTDGFCIKYISTREIQWKIINVWSKVVKTGYPFARKKKELHSSLHVLQLTQRDL